jgi:hypothetical protein
VLDENGTFLLFFGYDFLSHLDYLFRIETISGANDDIAVESY